MIHFPLLIDAINYYLDCGFQYQEAPWAVDAESYFITSPKDVKSFLLHDKFLVASGEQSFFQLIIDQKLSSGCYQTLTPCFRDEPAYNQLTRPYFMKLELIETQSTTLERLHQIVLLCCQFFGKYLPAVVVETSQQITDSLAVSPTYDIVCQKTHIELGSYGIRQHPKIGRWIYATGVAEPRLTSVIALSQKDIFEC